MDKKEEVKKSAQDLLEEVDGSVVYIGDDKNYWSTIQARISGASESLKFRFVHITLLTNLTSEQILLKILREKPKLIYLDFSTDTEEMLTLSKYLHDEVTTFNASRVGLIDSRDLIAKTKFAGCHFVHIKGGEYHDMVYDPLEINYNENIKQPEFAKANFSMESHLIDDMNAIYYTANGVHIEGNVKLMLGQAVDIKNSVPKDRVPSNKYFIKKTGAHDILSDAKYFYDIDFTFVNEPIFNNDELEKAKKIKSKTQRIQTLKLIKSDRQEQLDRYTANIDTSKEAQKTWIDETTDGKSISLTKVLVINFTMELVQEAEENKTEDRPYIIRYQTNLSETMKEVMLQRPAIIAFQILDTDYVKKLIINKGESSFDKEDRELTEAEAELLQETLENENESKGEQLASLTRRIKDIPNYRPMILVFNYNRFDSKGLQAKYSYPLMMANTKKLNVSTIKNMSEIYHKKAKEKELTDLQRKADILAKTGKMKDVSPEGLREKRVYPVIGDDLSFMSYGVPIKIKSMTETEVIFQADLVLDYLQVFRLEHPLSMSLTIVKTKNGVVMDQVNGSNQYRGLIHTVDEIDKKYIRQYVNEIIFSPKREERDKESSAFKDLNDKFQKLKEEQLREREESQDS